MQEIFVDAMSGNAWKNRTPQRIIRTDVDGSISIYIPINTGIRKSLTPYSSDITGTSISIGTSGTRTDPPAEKYRALGLEIKGNPLTQISEIPIN